MNTKSGVHICTRAAIVYHIRFENLEKLIGERRKRKGERTHAM